MFASILDIFKEANHSWDFSLLLRFLFDKNANFLIEFTALLWYLPTPDPVSICELWPLVWEALTGTRQFLHASRPR